MKKITLLLAFFACFSLQATFAQSTISGTVSSAADGSPVPGATVMAKGVTGVGTLTDIDGKYTLNVPASVTNLTVSFVGMKTVDVEISGRTTIDVALEADNQDIEEVVVTALGIKRNPKEVGVSTAKVSEKELTEAGASNVVNGLTGKVSGLQINTVNNGVSPTTRITLRGNRHFLASNEALVVLDGVPVSATYLSSINPNDIENVSVLKGASASALYGNEASNGVMIITTKRGDGKRKGVLKVSNTTTFSRVSYMPDLQERFGSGSGESLSTADNNYTMWINENRNTDPYTSYENQCFGPEYNGKMVILGGKLEDGSYQMVPYSAIKNQKRNFFQTGISVQNDVSYSGGDDKSSFYLSAQDLNTSGVIMDDKYRRTSTRFSASRSYGKFSADFTFGFTNITSDVSGGDMYQDRPVYWNVLNTPAHVPLTKYQDLEDNPFATVDGYYNAYYPNPYWQIKHSRQKDNKKDILGSVTLKYAPTKWLEFSNRTGLTYETRQDQDIKDGVDYSDYSKDDPWSQGHMGVSSPYSGNANDEHLQDMVISNDFFATADKTFGDFSAKIIVGSSTYSRKYRRIYMGSSALVLPELYNITNRTGEAIVAEEKRNRNSVGIFGDLTIGYKKFVFLHTSIRNDWDSRLAKENRSFRYPGADLSVILSEAISALKDNPVLSYLKIRGGWSKTGQIALTNYYATLPSYSTAAGFPYGSTTAFALSTRLSNPNLKPEMTKEYEAGIEMSFFKNRYHFEATYYQTNTSDQTIPADISAATGYTQAYINSGELQNKGLELDLRLTPLLSFGDVKWNLSINYSHVKSKVISIYPGLKEIYINNPGDEVGASYAVVGEEYPTIKVTDVYRDPNDNIIVDPVTGTPTKNPKLVAIGHGEPNHKLGISTSVTYKGFTLSAVAEYRGGNVIVNRVGNALDFTGVSTHSAQNGRQSFIIPNSVIEVSDGVYVPNTSAVVRNASRNFWVSSDYHNVDRTYVTSAAFWKLRELTLSYEIPTKYIAGGKFIRQASVSLVSRDLLMLRPKTNTYTDPEFNNQKDGTSNAVGYTTEDQTPPTRTFGFSIKLTF